MSQPLRIGQILIEQGVLNEQQVFEIRDAQKRLHLPFGVLAERLFDVTVDSLESAWIEQYHQSTGTIDLTTQAFDESVLSLITRRQAWQFELLPIGFEDTGELLIAASRERLARAVTFAAQRIEHVVYFRIAEPAQLRAYLQKYYPMAEISDSMRERVRQLAASGSRSA